MGGGGRGEREQLLKDKARMFDDKVPPPLPEAVPISVAIHLLRRRPGGFHFRLIERGAPDLLVEVARLILAINDKLAVAGNFD